METWLTASEAAMRLQVDASRIRQILLKDQEREERERIFPSGRKASGPEEEALWRDRRIGCRLSGGVWLIEARDVESRQEERNKGLLFLGRPPKWRSYYAKCEWFEGVAPAEEALTWACDGDRACADAMLSAPMRRYYERCLSTSFWIEGGWEMREPKTYTGQLRDAYQSCSCGKIALFMVPFHDELGVAKVIVQAERHFAMREHVGERSPVFP